jgi:phosphoribosylformimino-5-aminoimidazole carboxamide ribotide isomerase
LHVALRPFQLIGVIDLLGGRAVHARGGRRAEYQPVDTVAGQSVAGDAVAVARIYVEQLGLDAIYVADLDAIAAGAPQEEILRAIARLGAEVWIDAGIASAAQAQRALASGISRVIVGLETLHSFEQLGDVCSRIGGERVAFSLDLRGGVPINAPDAVISGREPVDLAAAATHAGAGAVIVLDLERVGSGAGLDVTLLGVIRRTAPGVTLLAGGGVRGPDDLVRLAEAGCDGALVATALHNGAIDPRTPR